MADSNVYQVQWGDTLTSIAAKKGTTVNKLVQLNNIKNPDVIIEGETLIISGTAKAETKTTTSYAKIERYGLVNNTQRNMFVTWAWSKSNTKHYQVKWYYNTGNDIWFIGSDSTTEDKQSLYTAPENALSVKVKIKPIVKDDVKGSDKWTAGWVTSNTYYFSKNPLTAPGKPSVTMDNYTLTAKLTDINVGMGAEKIAFEVLRSGSAGIRYSGTADIIFNAATMSWKVASGYEYVVQCRAIKNDGSKSPYSPYSDPVGTAPAASKGITKINAYSKTAVYLEWATATSATSYDLQYTDDKNLFDGSDAITTINGIESTTYVKTGLESGKEYFFRIRAVNGTGTSAWSAIKSITIGLKPAAPTTWSSSTTVIVGEKLMLYWVHNTEDNSRARSAQVELTVGNDEPIYSSIGYVITDDVEDRTYSYDIDTSSYPEGTTLRWRVRTWGISEEGSDWSTTRIVDIHARPSVELSVVDHSQNPIEVLQSYPLNISATVGPETQTPISYHITVRTDESYETVDNVGNPKLVNANEILYSKYIAAGSRYKITEHIHAGEITFESGVSYTVSCAVAMSSGLSAEASKSFTVSWSSEAYEPNAEIAIDKEALTAYIRPYCEDEEENLIPGVMLAVYRREFDGSFVELATGITNGDNTFIVDPHPALDLARYRIVATTFATGAICYFDIPGIEVGEKAVVLQWDEQWTHFDTLVEDDPDQPPWTGSMLKLPYNVDVSNSHDKDVELIEYIGRKHPVSYYGTQLGETATWNVDIVKDDKDTLYALRRLAAWTGDVYVREPSGSGYWANLKVSFSQTHRETAVPVTLDIVRVEGGI